MPYVSRRTMRWYRRLAPIQYVVFVAFGLLAAYTLLAVSVGALMGDPS